MMPIRSVSRKLLPRRSEPRRREVFYLVSTAGHPNYGDELITRAWLDELACIRPDDDVWLDCPHPGRAAHLFADTHPRLRVTNTLWELAHSSPSHDPIEDARRIARHVRDLGTPRIDAGLLTLRRVQCIHLLGGGYLNDMWQDNLGVVAAAAELARVFDIRCVATGLGLQPLSAERGEWLRRQFETFQMVEVRDRGSARILGGDLGLDDAFLALALADRRPVYDQRPTPEHVILVQGDLRAWTDEQAAALIEGALGDTPGSRVGFVEAIPPGDAKYVRCGPPGSRFYPFGEIWTQGLPARPGQQWLTTRFHAHLLGAAAGAAGTVLAGLPGYYDHKHESLLDLGTGWNVVGAEANSLTIAPTSNPEFPERARTLALQKRTLAAEIYRS